nr:insulinase family protein [candidate division Zixibacteria bacterium]
MIKKPAIIITILLISIAVYGQAGSGKSRGAAIIEAFKYEPIELNIPEIGMDIDRIVMDNGLVVYLYEDHSLPLFNLYTIIRCGDIFDPSEKQGLSRLVGQVMRTGGTETISGDSLNILLEFIAGSLETGIGMENGTANLSILSGDTEFGLKLYSDLLRHPAFPQDKIDLAKEDIKTEIKRRNDNPHGISSRYFDNIIYGDHPYGHIQEWPIVRDITRDDLVSYHRKYFVPENIIIGIAGDFNKKDVLEKLKKNLGDWKKSGQVLPDYPPVLYTSHPGVFQIKKEINQAYILLGHLGIKRNNPDRYAIDLLNYILGAGSFTSRLTSTVRSDEGLAYSVGSRYNTGNRDFGTFEAYCQTKSATAHKAIGLMLNEIRKIRDEGVTDVELDEAREATINRFIFNFDNSGEIINNMISLEFNGYPPDYYQRYLDYYRQVTMDDIKRVAIEYLKPDSLTLVVVGNPDDYDRSLDDFGQVTNIELIEPVIE